jgi:copper chaperone CopZ
VAEVRTPLWIVPVLVAVMAGAGLGGARLFAAPSHVQDYSTGGAGRHPETIRLIVRGLKCVDTARNAARQLEEVPGVIQYVAYASRNEARVTYDASMVRPDAIREAIEGPVFIPETGEILFHQFEVISVRGEK